jgi:serine/threonine-protein kinase
MDTRLFHFAETHQLSVPAQQELLTMVRDIVNESLEAGHCLLDWAEQDGAAKPPSEPLSFGDFSHETSSSSVTWMLEHGPSMKPEERYDVLDVLGTGSMGEVVRVRDKKLERVVAMKTMHDELAKDQTLVARFIEEAQATAQLQHPGVIPLMDLGQMSDGRYFFTMKEVKGRTLNDIILELHENSRYRKQWSETYDGWSFQRLVGAFRRVCDALAYAHSRGVIHRDLKPENVMLGDFGEVLVLDWGLVKVTGDGEFDDQVVSYRAQEDRFATVDGAVIGTPMYMSPEQALGNAIVDSRSDVYSLGSLLYEILSGRPPYEGTDYIEIMDKLLTQPPPPLLYSQEELQQLYARNPYMQLSPPPPEALVTVCMKAMAREPDDRYQDASQLATAIGAWLGS